jgi:prepilin-type N-terminal cleavage/methylation domain-containing protein
MKRGFTLIEIIIVIIIVGILAAVGISQYSNMVESSRIAEAKVRIGDMRKLAYEYFLNNGTLTGIANADVGVDDTCSASGYYRYYISLGSVTAWLYACRCTTDGKTPSPTRPYCFYFCFYKDTFLPISPEWRCNYTDNNTPCFGYPNG